MPSSLRDMLLEFIPGIKSQLDLPRAHTVLRTIMVLWVDKILGKRPAPGTGAAQLQNWTCSCEHCKKVRAFLREEPERSKTWERLGYYCVRQHLEKELKRFCWNRVSW
ncbi:hypothetical protein C8Q80DRAFT_1264420 [Daedaleopsis nitida]|nr:hypothetical protein C8Q80DRAFT_1264420 [Daedaleopsis nitida]